MAPEWGYLIGVGITLGICAGWWLLFTSRMRSPASRRKGQSEDWPFPKE